MDNSPSSRLKQPTKCLLIASIDCVVSRRLDLEAAIERNDASAWEVSYQFKQQYEAEDLSPKSFSNLVRRLERNETLYTIFLGHFKTGRIHECDEDCKKRTLCYLKCGSFAQYQECVGETSFEVGTLLAILLNKLMGD